MLDTIVNMVSRQKVNGVMRQYYFGNLNQFMLNYPDIPEFKSYQAIVAIF